MKVPIQGAKKVGHASGFTYIETPEVESVPIQNKSENFWGKKPIVSDPLFPHTKFFSYVLIVTILVSIGAYISYKFPKVDKERLTQTEYVTKLGQENADLQMQIGIVMAQQVQMGKDLQAKKKAYEGSVEVYSGSIAKVVELEGKIQENKELMISQIITQ